MRFCARLQLDRTRRVLDARQARIRKAARRRELQTITRITVIPKQKQLEIAMRALDNQNALQGRNETAA